MMLYEKLKNSQDTHAKFTESLQNIRIRHIDTVPNMAQVQCNIIIEFILYLPVLKKSYIKRIPEITSPEPHI